MTNGVNGFQQTNLFALMGHPGVPQTLLPGEHAVLQPVLAQNVLFQGMSLLLRDFATDGRLSREEALGFGLNLLEDEVIPEQWQGSSFYGGATQLAYSWADDGRLDEDEIIHVAGEVLGETFPPGAAQDWLSTGLQAFSSLADDGQLDGREVVGLALSAAQHFKGFSRFAQTPAGGALVSTGVSAVNNVFAAINGDMGVGDAIASTLVDGAISYGAVQLGAALGSFIPIPGVGTLIGAGLGFLVSEFGGDLINWAKEGLGNLIDNAGELLGDIGGAVADASRWLGDTVEGVVDAAGDVVNSVGGAVGDAVDAVGDAVGGAVDVVGDFIGGLF